MVYLCKHYGLNQVAEYWHQVVKINDYQKERFAQKIIDYFGGDLNGKKIAVLGWAFKANTNDSRESPSIKVADILLKTGALLSIYDPMLNREKIKSDLNINNDSSKKILIVTSGKEAINKVDAVAILTEWDEFKRLNFGENIPVFDGRNILNGNKIKSIGKNL